MSLSSDFASSGTAIRATDFNANVASVRQATVSPGTGMLIDNVPMGGTIVTPLSQKRMIRSKEESKFIPFALRSVNVGSKASPSWKKIVYFPDGACDIIGGWAMCDNEPFTGEQVWSKTGDWYYIADSTGNIGSSHIPDQSQVEYVYLHVLKTMENGDVLRSAIFTNSQLIPEDFNGYETDCICIGKFSCPTSSEISAGNFPRVLEQYVSGQVQVYGDLFPLKLTVVNIGSDADPEWVKAFWFAEGSVLYKGDIFAKCHNKPYPGYTMGDEGLYFVANPQGSNTQVPLQEDVLYAFLHVKYTGDETYPCVAIVTNDDVEIPAEFEGTEDYCCCIGRFTCPSADQVDSGVVPAVDQQFISSQVHVGADSSQEDPPFKIKRINVGTDESPSWKTAVYIPDGAFQLNGLTEDSSLVINECTEIDGHDNWYECDTTSSGNVYLNVIVGFYGDHSEADISPTYAAFRLNSTKSEDWTDYKFYKSQTYSYGLGRVITSANAVEQYHVGPIVANDDYPRLHDKMQGGGGGGGGGDMVVIDDQRKDKSAPGVSIFNQEDTVEGQHRVYFSIYDTIGGDKVVFGPEEGNGLVDYLAGDSEDPIDGLGKNVNTENFSDECLEQEYDRSEEMDLVGKSEIASRSDHKHSVDEILGFDDDGNLIAVFSNSDDFKTLLSDLNIWGDLEEPDPEDPDNPDGTLLSASDVNWDDDDQVKHDAESASPGGNGEYASLALADHVHPLNVVDAVDDPPDGEVPDPNDYILPVGSFVDPSTAKEDHYQADFGIKPYYARVDHIHPLSENIVTTDTEQDITSAKSFACPIYLEDDDFNDLASIKATQENGLILDGSSANKVVLAFAPNVLPSATGATTSLAVATCGWSSSNFIPKSSSSTGLIYNNNGVVSYKPIGSSGGVAEYSHTHSQYLTAAALSGYAKKADGISQFSDAEQYAKKTDNVSQFNNDAGYLKEIDLADYPKKDEFNKDNDDMFTDPFAQHAHWAGGILVAKSSGECWLSSFFSGVNIDGTKVGNLTANKVVTTDSNGKLSTSDTTVAKFSTNPVGGKWIKTSGKDGTVVESDDTPLVSDSTFSNDCLAAAVVSGNDKKIKSLSNPFTSSTQRQMLTYLRSPGDGTIIVRLDSYTIDKYGRISKFTQGSTQFALLLG